MATYSKYADINAVLNKASADLDKIEIEYNNSLNDQQIKAELLVDIKAYLGDLRSALDYLGNKIPHSEGNFPITDHANNFANRYLNVDPALRTIVEQWQPFNNNDWLQWFNILNNKNKHITLVPQIRKEVQEVRVSGQGGNISWNPAGVTFGNGVEMMGVPVDPNTQLPIPDSRIKVEQITWVHFLFDNTDFPSLPSDISALPFLKLCFEKTTKLIAEVEALLS